jgi:hypothetical protein
MEPTIKVGSKFPPTGEVVAIQTTGVLVSFAGSKTFISFSECELLFGV